MVVNLLTFFRYLIASLLASNLVCTDFYVNFTDYCIFLINLAYFTDKKLVEYQIMYVRLSTSIVVNFPFQSIIGKTIHGKSYHHECTT